MAADLDAVDLGPDVVCVVDHPVRQPQQPLLDNLEVVFGFSDHGAASFVLIAIVRHFGSCFSFIFS